MTLLIDGCAERHNRYHDVCAERMLDVVHQLTVLRLFSYGLNTGGPGVMSIGWIIVSFFSTPIPS